MKNDSKNSNIIVIQRSKEPLTLNKTPLIRVTPITTKVACEIGKVVTLTCIVQSPYVVEFKDISAAGRHVNITHTCIYKAIYLCLSLLLCFVCLGEGVTISHNFFISNCEQQQQTFICQEKNFAQFNKQITLVLSKESKHYLISIFVQS